MYQLGVFCDQPAFRDIVGTPKPIGLIDLRNFRERRLLWRQLRCQVRQSFDIPGEKTILRRAKMILLTHAVPPNARCEQGRDSFDRHARAFVGRQRADLSAATFDHVSDSPSLSIEYPGTSLRGKVQLPRDAKAVVEPTETLTETVVIQWHQNLTSFRESIECAVKLSLRLEVDER